MKKGIYKLNFDCGRQGTLTGVFIATDEQVNKLIESDIEVYFGEALGKHSEIYGPIDEGEIVFVSDNEEAVRVVEEHNLESGHNPFDYTSIGQGEEYDDMPVGEIIEKLLVEN